MENFENLLGKTLLNIENKNDDKLIFTLKMEKNINFITTRIVVNQ